MEISIFIMIILMIALAFGIGANDETMATLVGSHAIKVKTAIILGAILVFGGVIFLSGRVGETVGRNLFIESFDYTVPMMFAVILSTTIWLVVASRTGAPISTTHSVVGSVVGIALVWAIMEGVNPLFMPKLGEVALGWVISPIFGFIGAYLFQLLVSKFLKSTQQGLEQLEGLEKKFLYLLIIAVSWTQISRGGNDSANALGIMYGLLDSKAIDETWRIPLLIIIALVLALGLVIIGKNVIENVGQNLIEMRPSDAFSIQISTSIVIFLATMLGLPVSGSHILIFAVIGAGRVKGEKPDKKSFRKMVLSWILTFPIAAALSGLLYLVFIIL